MSSLTSVACRRDPRRSVEVATLCRLQRPGIGDRNPLGALDRAQLGRPIELEQRHPAEGAVDLAGLHPQDEVAVLDPGAARCRRNSRPPVCWWSFRVWRTAPCGGAAYSPMPYMMSARVSPARPTGQAMRHTDTPEARVTTSSLPAARLPRPIKRADHRADGQQFEGVLRQIEQREQKRIAGAVAADADIALLADEQEQARRASTAPPSPWPCRAARCDTDSGREYSRRPRLAHTAGTGPVPAPPECTHHTPIAGGRSPFSSHTLAADSRFE